VTHYLDLDDLLHIAEDAVEGEVGVRDHGLLEAAAARPQTTLFGEDAYPGLHEKAAALLHSIVRNHALVDGNKRLAWLATFVFLEINGRTLVAPDDDAVAFVLSVADGSLDDVKEIAAVLVGWT
jgi:death on curing protein